MTAQRPRPLTILHVIDKLSFDQSNPSSCTLLLANWAAAHDSARFTVKVCSLQRDPGEAYLEQQGVTVHCLQLGKISPRIAGELVTLIRRWDADIIHLHGYASANFGRLAARATGIPSIVHEHAVLRIRPHQFVADLLLRPLNQTGIAVSAAVKRFMVRGRSIPADKIQVIHNGIQLESFGAPTAAQVAAFRATHGVPDSGPVVGTVTRLFEIKGNRYLIDAFARLAPRFPTASLLIVGEGPDLAALAAQASQQGIDPARLIFTGFVKDVPTALAAMDILVVSSLQEGLSMVVLEAMAAGKPIIATRVGGIVELLESETTGLLIPPADAAALADSIATLLQDSEQAAALARAVRVASEKHSIENNVRRLEELYDRLLASPAPPHPSPGTGSS